VNIYACAIFIRRNLIVRSFKEEVEAVQDRAVQQVLCQLCALLALQHITEHMSVCLFCSLRFFAHAIIFYYYFPG